MEVQHTRNDRSAVLRRRDVSSPPIQRREQLTRLGSEGDGSIGGVTGEARQHFLATLLEERE
jgi:hypothetical protein